MYHLIAARQRNFLVEVVNVIVTDPVNAIYLKLDEKVVRVIAIV